MFATKPRIQPTAFLACPLDVLEMVLSIDREEVLDLYRKAYEQAREIHRPPITARLAPSRN